MSARVQRVVSRWSARLPSEALVSLLMVLLFGAATASFLIHERGLAKTFGVPLDSGWFDLTLGRSLFTGIGQPVPDATESPGYVVALGLVQALVQYDPAQAVLSAKLLSLVALSCVGLGAIRLVRALPGSGPYALLAVALMLPLSPALIWLGVSGLGLAWGVAFVALGLAEWVEGKVVRGTVFLGFALWMTPGAFLILVGTFLATRERWPLRVVLATGFIVPYVLWNLLASGWTAPFPGDAFGPVSVRQLLAWARSFLALSGLTLRGGTHPVLVPFLAGVGIWRMGRAGRILWVSVLLPAVFLGALMPQPGAFGRLLFVCLPPLFVLAAVGLQAIAARHTSGFLRGGRVASVVLLVYLALSGPNLWHVRQASAWQVENTVQVGEKAGRWLASNARPGELIATTAPGAISYFSRNPVLDLTRRPYRDMPLEELLLVADPPWVAMNIGTVVPKVLTRRYRAETTVVFRLQAGVYPPGPLIIFRRKDGRRYAVLEDDEGPLSLETRARPHATGTRAVAR